MSRQQRKKSQSGYYHVMLRGNEKRNIFLDEADKMHLIEIIGQKKQGEKFYLHAFCLMDNHVHLMISEGNEDIATVMKKITVTYVFYFNKKYKRVGHLFQDRFKSEPVESEAYILSLARYIHHNPVKAKIIKKPDQYKWSSYNGYVDDNNYGSSILDREIILNLFSNDLKQARTMFIEYMNEKSEDSFLDIKEEEKIMDEEKAKKLFYELLKQRKINLEKDIEIQIPDDLIWEFKEKTKLSLRKISEITGFNKDKVNRILKKSKQ